MRFGVIYAIDFLIIFQLDKIGKYLYIFDVLQSIENSSEEMLFLDTLRQATLSNHVTHSQQTLQSLNAVIYLEELGLEK